MENDENSNVFAVPNFWKPSAFSLEQPVWPSIFPLKDLDLKAVQLDNPYGQNGPLDDALKLPDINNFQFGPLEITEHPEPSATSSLADVEALKEEEPTDIWDLVLDEESLDQAAKFRCWETFYKQEDVPQRSAYISEAGQDAFDAALRIYAADNHESLGSSVEADVFISSLFALGLGRSSVLFRLDEKRKTFIPTLDDVKLLGCSVRGSHSVVRDFIACGTALRRLKVFIDRTYSSNKTFPGRVALANGVSTIISAIESALSDSFHAIKTLLQLQQAFARPTQIVLEILDVVKLIRQAKTTEDLASLLFTRCQHSEQEAPWLRHTLFELMSRASRPWLEVAEEWMGLRQFQGYHFGPDSHVNTFAEFDKDASSVDEQFILDLSKMPSFISAEDGQIIFNTGRSLRILRTHHPEHPLCKSYIYQDACLYWHFDWEHMETVASKAKEFERSLVAAIREYSKPQLRPASILASKQLNIATGCVKSWPAVDDVDEYLKPSAIELDHLPSPRPHLLDELFNIITMNLREGNATKDSAFLSITPPISLAPNISFQPLLAAQARLVNGTTIRMFFRSHQLRLHLNIQRQYHLLGDGVFVSRLTSAMFDPEMSTTERQLGVMRSNTCMGLKLGSRSAWPPASSELRLALSGILTDCYNSFSFGKDNGPTAMGTASQDLPGSLSFAIRHLSDAEAEKIMNPDSLFALDFLRLHYAPPPPLGAIITSAALDKYDAVFKLLLRITRLLFVIAHLPQAPRSSPQFIFGRQAVHFVTSCAAYFFDTGIRETWDTFSAHLDAVEKRLKEEDDNEEIGTRVKEGIDDLRSRHELCLDRIMSTLLLRHRQQKLMSLLENIFGMILAFAKAASGTSEVAKDRELVRLQEGFQAAVISFVEACRGLANKKMNSKAHTRTRADSSNVAAVEGNTIERLLLSLEMSGYYASR